MHRAYHFIFFIVVIFFSPDSIWFCELSFPQAAWWSSCSLPESTCILWGVYFYDGHRQLPIGSEWKAFFQPQVSTCKLTILVVLMIQVQIFSLTPREYSPLMVNFLLTNPSLTNFDKIARIFSKHFFFWQSKNHWKMAIAERVVFRTL